MKNVFLILSVFLCSYCCFAQQIERLSKREIEENESHRAVAYNFVTSIIEQDYVRMNMLVTDSFRAELQEWQKMDGVEELNELFTPDHMHDIVDMRPVVNMGYDVVLYDSWILDTDLFFYRYGEPNPYEGLPAYSVSFTCADSNNEIYDGSCGKYDVTARVLLVEIDDHWKVFGFK